MAAFFDRFYQSTSPSCILDTSKGISSISPPLCLVFSLQCPF
uniref:Uncharacterized protein n=1 Tax=Arundo donax TaxID=35708 RepID=A0A0A9E2N2_ARUDO